MSATSAEITMTVGAAVFLTAATTAMVLLISLGIGESRRLRDLPAADLSDDRTPGWDRRARDAVLAMSNDKDRARLASDLIVRPAMATRQTWLAMAIGMAGGIGGGLAVGPRVVGDDPVYVLALITVALGGGALGMFVGIGFDYGARRVDSRLDPLRAAAAETAWMLNLPSTDSRYWSRRGRFARLQGVRAAFSRAGVPNDDLPTDGLVELDSSKAWTGAQQRVVDRLVRAYEGDFIGSKHGIDATDNPQRWIHRSTLTGAVLAILGALASLAQTLMTLNWQISGS